MNKVSMINVSRVRTFKVFYRVETSNWVGSIPISVAASIVRGTRSRSGSSGVLLSWRAARARSGVHRTVLDASWVLLQRRVWNPRQNQRGPEHLETVVKHVVIVKFSKYKHHINMEYIVHVSKNQNDSHFIKTYFGASLPNELATFRSASTCSSKYKQIEMSLILSANSLQSKFKITIIITMYTDL